MNAKLRWNPNIPAVLRQSHDEIRAELVRAAIEPGPIGEAAKRVAQLCLPHFEEEERRVFPIFGLLDDLAISEVRQEMAEMLPLISDFSRQHNAMEAQHGRIVSAIAALKQAALKERNREFAEFACCMNVHERIEEEVIYPTVILIGKYLRQCLRLH